MLYKLRPRFILDLVSFTDSDIHKNFGDNALRAFRAAGKVSKKLRATTAPEIGELEPGR